MTMPLAEKGFSEVRRQLVHLSMGGFALLLRWLSPAQAFSLAILALLFNLFVLPRLAPSLYRRPGHRLDPGIIAYPATLAALILIFHAQLYLVAAIWGILALGDSSATLVGRADAGPRLPWNEEKSWAGMLAYAAGGSVAATVLMVWSYPSMGNAAAAASPAYLFGVVPLSLAVLSALLESFPSGLDDNILVPLLSGAFGWALLSVDPLLVDTVVGVWVPRLPEAMLVNLLVAAATLALGLFHRSGAMLGWILGTALYAAAGRDAFLILVVMFILGSGTSLLAPGWKAARGMAQGSGGAPGAATGAHPTACSR
ncbi:MAG: hypothetical protein ACE5HV_08030, partial [Acidobacteriota bacterium]